MVLRPENKSVVSSRWLYKVKQAANGSVENHKAGFVSRGFSQVKGIDYVETFSPIARYSSIRSMLALSAQMGWKIHQMDVKTKFLNVWQKDAELLVSQGKYANEILKRFHMEKCKPMKTHLAGNYWKEDVTSREVVEDTVYRELVGSVMYLVNT
eukprot:PITA_02037